MLNSKILHCQKETKDDVYTSDFYLYLLLYTIAIYAENGHTHFGIQYNLYSSPVTYTRTRISIIIHYGRKQMHIFYRERHYRPLYGFFYVFFFFA